MLTHSKRICEFKQKRFQCEAKVLASLLNKVGDSNFDKIVKLHQSGVTLKELIDVPEDVLNISLTLSDDIYQVRKFNMYAFTQLLYRVEKQNWNHVIALYKAGIPIFELNSLPPNV